MFKDKHLTSNVSFNCLDSLILFTFYLASDTFNQLLYSFSLNIKQIYDDVKKEFMRCIFHLSMLR